MKPKTVFILFFTSTLIFLSCEEVTRITGIRTITAFSSEPGTAYVKAEFRDLSYEKHTEYGFCYDTLNYPTINGYRKILGTTPSIGNYEAYLSNLDTGKNFYIRGYIAGEYGVVYGNVLRIDTASYGYLIDHRDNLFYRTVKIGNQIWMAENLNYPER